VLGLVSTFTGPRGAKGYWGVAIIPALSMHDEICDPPPAPRAWDRTVLQRQR